MLAHARRKLYDVHHATQSAAAKELLEQIGELFAVEEEIRGRSPQHRQARAPSGACRAGTDENPFRGNTEHWSAGKVRWPTRFAIPCHAGTPSLATPRRAA